MNSCRVYLQMIESQQITSVCMQVRIVVAWFCHFPRETFIGLSHSDLPSFTYKLQPNRIGNWRIIFGSQALLAAHHLLKS